MMKRKKKIILFMALFVLFCGIFCVVQLNSKSTKQTDTSRTAEEGKDDADDNEVEPDMFDDDDSDYNKSDQSPSENATVDTDSDDEKEPKKKLKTTTGDTNNNNVEKFDDIHGSETPLDIFEQ